MDEIKLRNIRSNINLSNEFIYFNNIEISPLSNIIINNLQNTFLYSLITLNNNKIELKKQIYLSISLLINSNDNNDNNNQEENEIILIDSGLNSWSFILNCIELNNNDIILISKIENGKNYLSLLHYIKYYNLDVKIIYIPSEYNSSISLTALKSLLDTLPNIKLVCLTWIPMNGIDPTKVYECGQILSQYPNILYFIDATHAVGLQKIHVQELKCSILIGSCSYYLRAPIGTDFVYISQSTLSKLKDPSIINFNSSHFIDLQSYQIQPTIKKYENYSGNITNLTGVNEAILEYLNPQIIGVDWVETRLQTLSEVLIKSFHELELLSQDNSNYCRELILWNASTITGILCFTINGISSSDIITILKNRNILASICSHEVTYIDSIERRLPDRVRISLHYFNTEIEIFILCDLLKELLYEE